VLREIYLATMGQHGTAELVAALVLLCATFAAAPNARPSRCRVITAVGLFAGALLARCLVPWVPANYYSDLAAPYPSFAYDPSYLNPFYDVLWRLTRISVAPFVLNVILGSVVPALLYLTLSHPAVAPRGLHEAAQASGASRAPPKDADDPPSRLALPFAAVVAVHPLYVRLSASEAPHVAALFVLALGAWHFRRAMANRGFVPHLGMLASAFLVGAIRQELAAAPVLYGFLAIRLHGRAVLENRRWGTLLLLAGATVAGGLFTHVAVLGHSNAEPTLEWATLGRYLGRFPGSLLPRDAILPLLLTAGLPVLLLDSLVRRRWLVPVAYVAGMLALTWPYALVAPFAESYASPLGIWTFSRYALLWYLFPTYFAVWGLSRAFGRRWLLPFGLDRAAVALALWVNALPAYRSLHPFQLEYRFLREFLQHDRTELPVLVGWQKNAGNDFCEALALPFFALSGTGPPRDWLVRGSSSSWKDVLAALPGKTYYFRNVLPDIELGSAPWLSDADRAEMNRALASFRQLRCLAEKNGTLVSASAEQAVAGVQFLPQGARLSPAIYLLDPGAAGWDLAGCVAAPDPSDRARATEFEPLAAPR
jgi:hypothetical protein